MEAVSRERITLKPKKNAKMSVLTPEVPQFASSRKLRVHAKAIMKSGTMMHSKDHAGLHILARLYSTFTFRQFRYGGCLGNGNRFVTKKACEAMCQPKENEPLCMKPKAEGACNGDYPRWFFDANLGECQEFSYSGCRGNNNRFMTKYECENTCKHAALARFVLLISRNNNSLIFNLSLITLMGKISI